MKNFSEKLPYIIAAIAAVFSFIYFFPGYMAGDSVTQWRQVLNEARVTNYHPPIMVYLWKFTRIFFDGPEGLHLIQCSVYWISISLLANFFTNKNWLKIIIILLLGFFPPTYLWSLHLLKDTGLLASFSMATALILNFQKYKQKIHYAYIAIIFIFYGIAVRHNALFTGLILLFLDVKLIYEFYKENPHSNKKLENFFLSLKKSYLTIAAAIIILLSLVNNVGVKRYNTFGTVYLWDLAAISVDQNKMLLPRPVIIDQTLSDEEIVKRLTENYTPNRCNSVFMKNDVMHYEQKKVYWGHYLKTIIENPLSYLKHRIEFIKYFLGISANGNKGYVYAKIEETRVFEERKNSKFFQYLGINEDIRVSKGDNRQSLLKLLLLGGTQDHLLIFSAYFYILIFLGLLFTRYVLFLQKLAPKIDIKSNSTIIFISGLFYILPLCFFAPAEDYRYTIWFVFSTIISSILLVKESCDKNKIRKNGK